MSRSAQYWQERSEEVLLAAERQGSELVDTLNGFYKDTTRIILQDMEAFYGRYADRNGITLQEAKKRLSAERLDSFRDEMERYYSEVKRLGLGKDYEDYLRRLSARGYISRQEELLTQVRHQTALLANREVEAYLGTLREVYGDSYYRTIFDTQKGLGFGTDFNVLDSETIERVIRRPWLESNFSDRIWEDKERLFAKLDRIIPQAFATGQNSQVLGQRLAQEMGVSRSNAERLVRTEVNHAANQATYASYRELGVEEYQYLSTLDSRTSAICQDLDKRVFRLADAQVGVNYPPAHPNCRSTTVPYFPPDEFDEPGERAARGADGKTYYVPNDMSYKEWYEEFVANPGEKAYNNFKDQVHKIILAHYNLKVHKGRQDKHILGTNNYIAGRSALTADAQQLIDQYAGKSEPLQISRGARKGEWIRKERFTHSEIIGTYIDADGTETETNAGTIHYSKNGVHIVPARPPEE